MSVGCVAILIEVFVISTVWTHCWERLRVKRGFTRGLRGFEKNILKNEGEKNIRKEWLYRNEINP
jgi:hypothetical protein